MSAAALQTSKREYCSLDYKYRLWLTTFLVTGPKKIGMPAPAEIKRIVLFTLPPVREIDLVGAVDVFTSANRAAGGKPLYDIKIVNAEKARADGKIAGMCGLSFHCH